MAEAGPSTLPPATDDVQTHEGDLTKRVISLHVPSNLLILPPAAGLVGMVIGMRRGGSKARLRFLAENAHRQPKTVQGWYFYTKTRNYRVFFAAMRTGGKYSLGLSAAATLFVCADEGMGWLREHFIPVVNETRRADPRRVGWRKGPVHWEDGAVAGGVLAVATGLAYRLPNPLMIRALIMGIALGATTSALQIAQDHVAVLKAQQEEQERATAATVEATQSSERLVDAPARPSEQDPRSPELEMEREAAFLGSAATDMAAEQGWMDWIGAKVWGSK